MAEHADVLQGLDAAALAPVVRDALREPTARLEGGWSRRRLGGGAGGALGVYHLAGQARAPGAARPWSLVLKICPAAGEAAPHTWEYPPREALAYGSGLLASLPAGVVAPRCFGVVDRPDGTTWLWLEAVADEKPGPWPLDRHILAARHLGRFNGAYLVGAPLPHHPWLDHGSLRDLVEGAGGAVADLDRLTGPAAPALVRRFYPPPVVAALRRLWAEREALLGGLGRLPRTLCHRDAHRRNLLDRIGPGGTEQTVAIDWAYVGHGALGEEVAGLVMSNLLFFEAAGTAPRDLDTACFAGYLDGLRDAGWVGDARPVRLGYAGAAAMRYGLGLLPRVAATLGDPALHPFAEQLLGRPMGEVVDAWAAELWPFLLGLAEEARELLRSAG